MSYPKRLVRTVLMLDLLESLFTYGASPSCSSSELERIRGNILTILSTIGIVGALFSSFTFPSLIAAMNLTATWTQIGYGVSLLFAFFTSLLATVGCAAYVSFLSLVPATTLIPLLKSLYFLIPLPLLCLEGSYSFCLFVVLFSSESNDADHGAVWRYQVLVRVIVALAVGIPFFAMCLFAAVHPRRLQSLFSLA
jgi:hypothetical protein